MKLILVMALTVDGKIGKDDAHFPDWTGSEDKKMFKAVTRRAGVVIMGSKTYDTIGKPLPGRKNVILTRNPHRLSEGEAFGLYEQGSRDNPQGTLRGRFQGSCAGRRGPGQLPVRPTPVDR